MPWFCFLVSGVFVAGETLLFSQYETYQRALLHYTRAATQGSVNMFIYCYGV